MHSAAPYPTFTPAEHANFLAAKAVAHATAYLDGRNDAALLARNAHSVQYEILAAPEDPLAKPALDAARMLVVAMLGASTAIGEVRQDRWRNVMGALVELVCGESMALRIYSGADT
jgi:hypothetical protein